MSVQLLYFANPMCSWCWGFAPSLDAVERRFGTAAPITLILGSLGRGDRPMRDADKAVVREHWEHVRDASGQPFDFAFFEREGFVYDTARPARAVQAARELAPEAVLPLFHRLQHAFYALNRDVTDDAVLVELAAAAGLDEAGFRERLGAPDRPERVEAEFADTARLGVTGYPTMVGVAGGRAFPVTVGWRAPADLVALLEPVVAAAAAQSGSV